VFEGWDNFYEITGTAAATLIGLLFVIVSLSENRDRSQLLRAASIYLTPTALHFAVVLTVSAIAAAPRRLALAVQVLVIAVAALTGLGNAVWACLGMSRFTPGGPPPHWSDFWLYGAAPMVLYLALAVATVALGARATWACGAVAITLLALLMVGIRNAWDLVTWMAPARGATPEPQTPPPDSTSRSDAIV
jgi:hypothetical protein